MRKSFVWAVVSILAIIALVACGGGGGGSSSTATPNADVSGWWFTGDYWNGLYEQRQILQSSASFTVNDIFGNTTATGTVSGNNLTFKPTAGGTYTATYDNTNINWTGGGAWTKAGTPSWKTVTTNNSIVLDGNTSEWSLTAAGIHDAVNDSTGNVNTEIEYFALERNATNLYFKIELASGSTFTFPHSTDTDDGYGITIQPNNDSQSYYTINIYGSGNASLSYNGSGNTAIPTLSVNGRYLELSIPLSQIGTPTKIAAIARAWYFRTGTGGGEYDKTDAVFVNLQ